MTIQSLIPLGDQASLAAFADEDSAFRFATAVREQSIAGVVDVVQAYATVAVFFDLHCTTFSQLVEKLKQLDLSAGPAAPDTGRIHHIPCCYELALDLARVAEFTRLSPEEIVRLHSEAEYTVYAIGFCPGFPYLGYLPAALTGVPRLPTPRLRLEAGSVGLTGRQTGIYTEPRPGGWNIIGRTPLELVNVGDGYFPLRTGDRVRFEPISQGEFSRLFGRRL